MTYCLVFWLHDTADEPILLYSEIDASRLEKRKVEVFRNGAMDFADALRSAGQTSLSCEPMPSLEWLRSQNEFYACSIGADEFEQIWVRAHEQHRQA